MLKQTAVCVTLLSARQLCLGFAAASGTYLTQAALSGMIHMYSTWIWKGYQDWCYTHQTTTDIHKTYQHIYSKSICYSGNICNLGSFLKWLTASVHDYVGMLFVGILWYGHPTFYGGYKLHQHCPLKILDDPLWHHQRWAKQNKNKISSFDKSLIQGYQDWCLSQNFHQSPVHSFRYIHFETKHIHATWFIDSYLTKAACQEWLHVWCMNTKYVEFWYKMLLSFELH